MDEMESDFLLKLINGTTSIMDINFLRGKEARKAEKTCSSLVEQIKNAVPKSEQVLVSDLDSTINAVLCEACIQAYLDGLAAGTKLTHILLKNDPL